MTGTIHEAGGCAPPIQTAEPERLEVERLADPVYLQAQTARVLDWLDVAHRQEISAGNEWSYFNKAAAVIRRLAAGVTPQGWLPIESAPRDGTAIIGLDPDLLDVPECDAAQVVRWRGAWSYASGEYTHSAKLWRPLPPMVLTARDAAPEVELQAQTGQPHRPWSAEERQALREALQKVAELEATPQAQGGEADYVAVIVEGPNDGHTRKTRWVAPKPPVGTKLYATPQRAPGVDEAATLNAKLDIAHAVIRTLIGGGHVTQEIVDRTVADVRKHAAERSDWPGADYWRGFYAPLAAPVSAGDRDMAERVFDYLKWRSLTIENVRAALTETCATANEAFAARESAEPQLAAQSRVEQQRAKIADLHRQLLLAYSQLGSPTQPQAETAT